MSLSTPEKTAGSTKYPSSYLSPESAFPPFQRRAVGASDVDVLQRRIELALGHMWAYIRIVKPISHLQGVGVVDDRIEELADRLAEPRTRVDRIEENAVGEFNEHMETVLDILEYENLDRIWTERRETEVRADRRKVTRTQLDLHIVRSSTDGTVYEDTVDHLSESEREATGLVFALASYLVHDVHETVPFVLLDSLEAIELGSRAVD